MNRPRPRPGPRGRGPGRPTPRRPGQSQTDRRGLGGEQVEGRQAVRELLAARRRPVRDVWLAEGSDESLILTEIRDLALDNRVPVRAVSRGKLAGEARTEAPQGVLAHAAPLPESELADLIVPSARTAPFLIALDGVTDPHNLGALLRTAESAGATGVVLPRHRAAHVTPTVAKAAAGAIEYLPMAVVPGLPAALAELKQQGVWTVGLAADAPASLFGLELSSEPICLVLGAEGKGLSRLTRQRCDLLVAIPQRGRLGSLNVAAAATVACFEVARRRAD